MLAKDNKLAKLNEQLYACGQEIGEYRSFLPNAALKLRELCLQKSVLKRMLSKAQMDLQKARDYMRKLLPRHQPKSILKTNGAKKHPTSYFTQKDCQDVPEEPRILTYQSKCVKLRRCVIAIIAANRLTRMGTRVHQTQLDEGEIDWVISAFSSTRSKSQPSLKALLSDQFISGGSLSARPMTQSYSIFNNCKYESMLQLLQIGLQNISQVLTSAHTASRSTIDKNAVDDNNEPTLPKELRKLFLTSISKVKDVALMAKANMVLREEELHQSKEQCKFYEVKLVEQTQNCFSMQQLMTKTGSEFDQFKERHIALQAELQASVPMEEYTHLKETLVSMDEQAEKYQTKVAK